MKKIFATAGSFLIVFGLFFMQSVFAQNLPTNEVAGLKGPVIIINPSERAYDVSIEKASYLNNIFSLDLKITKTQNWPASLSVELSRVTGNVEVFSKFLKKDQPVTTNTTQLFQLSAAGISPGEYKITISDGLNPKAIYQEKKFSLTVSKSDTEKEDSSNETNDDNSNTDKDREQGIVTEGILGPDAKLKNPFKALGSFEKIASAFLTGIVIPVGIPVLAIAIMYTGFLFVAARGNPKKLDDAKKAALWTAVGGFIMLGSLTIVRILQSTFDNISGSL